LAIVMMLLLAAAVAAGIAQMTVRSDVGTSEALARQITLSAATDSASALAAADLLDSERVMHAPALDGSRSATYEIGDVSVRVWALSENGRLNPNFASSADTEELLKSSGLNSALASAVARRLESARQSGDSMTHPVDMRPLFKDNPDAFDRTLAFVTTRTSAGLEDALAARGLKLALPRLESNDETPQPKALSVSEFPTLAFFLKAELPNGAFQAAEQIVSVSRNGSLLILENRPLKDATLAAIEKARQ
jgi:hypothetical protein